MRWVHAWRVVAAMTNEHAIRDGSIGHLERDSMSHDRSAPLVDNESAIRPVAPDAGPSPRPAVVRPPTVDQGPELGHSTRDTLLCLLVNLPVSLFVPRIRRQTHDVSVETNRHLMAFLTEVTVVRVAPGNGSNEGNLQRRQWRRCHDGYCTGSSVRAQWVYTRNRPTRCVTSTRRRPEAHPARPWSARAASG